MTREANPSGGPMRDHLALIVAGIIVGVIGLSIVATEGGHAAYWVGWVILGVGGMVVQVGIIATGVALGFETHRRNVLAERSLDD